MTENAPYAGWAMLELMGHRQRVGWVYEHEAYGGKLLAIDLAVWREGDFEMFERGPTEFYGMPAIYSLRPLSVELVRDHLRETRDPRPVQPMQYRIGKPPGARDMFDALGEKTGGEAPDEGDF